MADCGVCLYGEPDGVAEFQEVTYPKARKQHKCCECYREIPIGATYQRSVMKFDGDLHCDKTCAVCAEIRRAFYCECELIGEFWSQMTDYVFPELTEACFLKLKTPEAKKYLRERWMKWKGLLD